MGTERWWNILAAEYWRTQRQTGSYDNLFVTCVHNMPHVDYHVTELRSLWWAAGIFLTAWGMLHLTPRMTVSHLNIIFNTTTFSSGCTYSVSENTCYQHTIFYVRDVPKNTHNRMQRPKSGPRHNAVNTNALWHLQFLIPVLPLHQHM